MGDIKSAWEIAHEKADKLGELSSEEKRRQKEERYSQIGKTLADKYLERENTRYLETELKKYDEQDKESITRAILKRLTDAIDLRYAQALDKIKEGISVITKNSAKNIISQVEELFREYQEAEDGKRKEIEKAGREILHQMRISGSAVGKMNIQANAQWQKDLAQISQSSKEKLESLKQKLLSIQTGYP